MGIANRFDKDPDSERSFAIDWAEILASRPTDTTLVSVAWTIPAGLTKVDAATGVSGTLGIVRLSGGVLGATYEVLGVATFADGQHDARRITIRMRSL